VQDDIDPSAHGRGLTGGGDGPSLDRRRPLELGVGRLDAVSAAVTARARFIGKLKVRSGIAPDGVARPSTSTPVTRQGRRGWAAAANDGAALLGDVGGELFEIDLHRLVDAVGRRADDLLARDERGASGEADPRTDRRQSLRWSSSTPQST